MGSVYYNLLYDWKWRTVKTNNLIIFSIHFLWIFCAPHLLVSLTSQDLFRFRCVKYLSACVNLRRFLKQSFESLLGIMLACVETVLMTVRWVCWLAQSDSIYQICHLILHCLQNMLTPLTNRPFNDWCVGLFVYRPWRQHMRGFPCRKLRPL